MEGQRNASQGSRRTPPTVPIQRDFLFVDAAQAKTSRQGRRNARSFVMQKARRERPWSTSKNAAKHRKPSGSTSPRSAGTPDSLILTPQTATPSPPIFFDNNDYFYSVDGQPYAAGNEMTCPECNIFMCRSGEWLCPRCLLLKPIEDPNNSLFDPFQASSIQINGSVSELLEHFVREMAPGVIAVDCRHRSDLMRSDWFATAMNNVGFMYSLLSTAALHLYMSGRGSIETILYYRAKAIVAVNAAISDPDQNVGISDANIGAVFNLLAVEESLLNPLFEHEALGQHEKAQPAVHMQGMRRMVELRGGLGAMSSNRALQAFMLWHSTAHAIASFEAPEPSTRDYILNGNFPHHPLNYQPNISHHLLDCCRLAGVDESLINLVKSVLILIADLNEWFSNANNNLDPLDIQNYSCVLECLSLKWLRDNENLHTPLENALCVALLIITVRTTEALKGRPIVHMLHLVASKRLEQALNCTIRSDWQFCPDLLIWILSIGAISADGSPESDWFAYQVSLACGELGISSVETLLVRLQYCGWVNFKLDEAVRCLWSRITDLRLAPIFEAPANADSSVGPMQHCVAEPCMEEWKHDDWRALDLGPDVSNVRYTPGGNNFGENARDGISAQLRDEPLGGSDGVLFDYGRAYHFGFHFGQSG